MNELQAALTPYLSLPKLRRLVARDAAHLRDALTQPDPPAELAQLLAALAVLLEPPQRTQITMPDDLAALLVVEMSQLEQEQLRVALLNTKNHLLAVATIYVGTINHAAVRIAEVFRPALRHNAAAVIVAHNHPSGDPTPSLEDALLTRQLIAAGQLLEIAVLDHLVIGRGRWTSLRTLGMGFDGARTLAGADLYEAL
jgi:DNA repair protein RadC